MAFAVSGVPVSNPTAPNVLGPSDPVVVERVGLIFLASDLADGLWSRSSSLGGVGWLWCGPPWEATDGLMKSRNVLGSGLARRWRDCLRHRYRYAAFTPSCTSEMTECTVATIVAAPRPVTLCSEGACTVGSIPVNSLAGPGCLRALVNSSSSGTLNPNALPFDLPPVRNSPAPLKLTRTTPSAVRTKCLATSQLAVQTSAP